MKYLSRALELAERGLFTAHPNPRVGCVIVNNQQIVGEGWHAKTGGPHAEVVALAQAGDKARGATCYVTLEPCAHQGKTPPCVDALINANIAKVVIGMQDPNPEVAGKGVEMLRKSGIEVLFSDKTQVFEMLNRGFVTRMTQQKPWVRLKVGMSLDGRVAMASGESQWITSESAREDVQRWRAQSGAILTGIDTVLTDDPRLTVRNQPVVAQPLRVVLDTHLRITDNLQLFEEKGQILLATCVSNHDKIAAIQKDGVEVVNLAKSLTGRIELPTLMSYLAIDRQINDVWVEAGPRLSGALLEAGLVDELIVYQAPKLLGNAAKGPFEIPTIQNLSDHIQLEMTDMQTFGNDRRFTFKPVTKR